MTERKKVINDSDYLLKNYLGVLLGFKKKKLELNHHHIWWTQQRAKHINQVDQNEELFVTKTKSTPIDFKAVGKNGPLVFLIFFFFWQ